jgi:hypothetical protein
VKLQAGLRTVAVQMGTDVQERNAGQCVIVFGGFLVSVSENKDFEFSHVQSLLECSDLRVSYDMYLTL